MERPIRTTPYTWQPVGAAVPRLAIGAAERRRQAQKRSRITRVHLDAQMPVQ